MFPKTNTAFSDFVNSRAVHRISFVWPNFYLQIYCLNELNISVSVYIPFMNIKIFTKPNNMQFLQTLHNLYFSELMLNWYWFDTDITHAKAVDGIKFVSTKFYLQIYCKVCPLCTRIKFYQSINFLPVLQQMEHLQMPLSV